MTCLLRKSSLLTFTICANRLPRHEGQLTTFNHFDRRLRECSLATLISSVVSTGGATDPQKLSMNSVKTIVVLPKLLQRTRRRVLRKSPAYHVDDRADGFESGGHPLMNSLPKASDHFLRICRAVEVANTHTTTSISIGCFPVILQGIETRSFCNRLLVKRLAQTIVGVRIKIAFDAHNVTDQDDEAHALDDVAKVPHDRVPGWMRYVWMRVSNRVSGSLRLVYFRLRWSAVE